MVLIKIGSEMVRLKYIEQVYVIIRIIFKKYTIADELKCFVSKHFK